MSRFKSTLMIFGVSIFTTLVSISANAALDCRSECMSSRRCLKLSPQSQYAVKTLVDLLNLYSTPKIKNVDESSCSRTNSTSGYSFTSTGTACKEWSSDGFHKPGDSVDYNQGIFTSVLLPASLKGTFSRENKSLNFPQTTKRPFFSMQSDGNVVTASYIDSVFVTEINHFTRIILQGSEICYSVKL